MPLPLPGSRVAPGKLDRVAGVAAASDLARERRHRRPARTRPVDSGCSWQSSAAAVVQRAWPATANQAVFDWLLITAPMVVHAEADVFTHPRRDQPPTVHPPAALVPASAALPFPCFKLVLLKLPLTHAHDWFDEALCCAQCQRHVRYANCIAYTTRKSSIALTHSSTRQRWRPWRLLQEPIWRWPRSTRRPRCRFRFLYPVCSRGSAVGCRPAQRRLEPTAERP